MEKIILYIVIVLGLHSCNCFRPIERTETITRDTIITEIKQDTLFLEAQAEKIIIKDTIIKIAPFVAKIDTVLRSIYKEKIKYDTVNLSYSVMDNDFKMKFRPERDTSKKEVETIVIKEYFENPDSVWDNLYLFIAGCFSGGLMTVILMLRR